jgi:hypothetical protein
MSTRATAARPRATNTQHHLIVAVMARPIYGERRPQASPPFRWRQFGWTKAARTPGSGGSYALPKRHLTRLETVTPANRKCFKLTSGDDLRGHGIAR